MNHFCTPFRKFRQAAAAAATAAALAGAALVTAGASEAAAQPRPAVLSLLHWFDPSHPVHYVLNAWARSVEADSHGTIRVTIEPRGALGQGQDHLAIVRRGSADLVLVEPITEPSRFPVMATAALPFQIARGVAGSKAIDEWYRPLAEREMAAVKFCFAFVSEPGTLHTTDKKVLRPEDLKGRTVGADNAVLSMYLRDLGATTEIAPESLLRAQLDSKSIRSTLQTWSTVMRMGADKELRYHMDVPFFVTPLTLVLSKATYSTLAPAQKQVIDDHCSTAAAGKYAALWAETEIAARTDLQRDEAHDVYPLTAADKVSWLNAVVTLRDRLAVDAKLSGFDPDQYLPDFDRALAKHKAAD